MLRVTAALALVVGASALLAYLHALGRGPFVGPTARHLRAMKDRIAAPDTYKAITFADMAALPRGASLAEFAPFERRGVAIEGYVQSLLRAVDGDLHLDLAPDYGGPESPEGPYVITEVTPQWRGDSRSWSYEGLAAALQPRAGGVTPWDGGPRRVRLGGWLLYDYPHEGRLPRPGRPPALTRWEVHPVTRIEVWEDSLGRFVEHER